jgi:hypothetical protein
MMFPNSNPGKFLAVIAAILLLVAASGVQAARISVQADHSPVALDEPFQLVFTVEGEPDRQPDFSVLEKDFKIRGSSQSRNISYVNGKISNTIRYLVTVLPRRAGELRVPPVAFGKDSSPEFRISVHADPPGSKTGNTASAGNVFLEVSVDNPRPWVQQQVILTVRIFSRVQWREASLSEPGFQGGEVLMQKLGEDRSYQTRRDGSNWQVIERRYALFPQKSGELRMDAMQLNLRVPSARKKQRSPFGSFNDPFFNDFFSSRSYRTRVVHSKELTLEVKPVPPEFSGSHWLVAEDVQLKESWSEEPTALKTGEPVTRTLTIVADGVTLGQLPELDLPSVQGLRIYPDEPGNQEQVTDQGLRSTSSRKFAIIPTHPGSYTLPAVEISWWNSRTGQEEKARLPAASIQVSGGVVQETAPVNLNPGSPAEPASADMPDLAKPAPLKVSAGTEELSGVNLWLAAASLILLLLWLVTLILLWRAWKRVPVPGPEEGSHSPGRPRVDMGVAWSALHQAVQAGDAPGVNRALLSLAAGIWPQSPPRSLDAMAERVGAPLAEELHRLSRHLYADDSVAWNPSVIETAMKKLKTSANGDHSTSPAAALKPLYPSSGE